jgi:hypothetical protein
MPTFETLARFEAGWRIMTREQQAAFRGVVLEAFTPDVSGPARSFRPELSVRAVPGHPGLHEMSWSEEGKAAFSYGAERIPGEPHVIWWQITASALPAGSRATGCLSPRPEPS